MYFVYTTQFYCLDFLFHFSRHFAHFIRFVITDRQLEVSHNCYTLYYFYIICKVHKHMDFINQFSKICSRLYKRVFLKR